MMDNDQVDALLSAVKQNRMLHSVLMTTTDLVVALVASRCEVHHLNITAYAARLIVRGVMADKKPPTDAAEWIARIDAVLMALPPATKCPHCGLISYNPDDVANRYCGNCHVFYEAPS